MSRRTVVGLDPTLPNPTEEDDTESKAEEPQDTPPAKLRAARSAKVAPSPVPSEPYTPTTAPSFLALGVPGAASCSPQPEDGGGVGSSGAPLLTPVHRLTNVTDDEQGQTR